MLIILQIPSASVGKTTIFDFPHMRRTVRGSHIYETKNGAFSMDANVYERLKEKEQRMLDAIDSHVLEAMPTSDEELEAIFAQLRLE